MRMLLVDDHRLFLEGLSDLLTAQGLEVVELAHDGLDALDAARRLRPDVILMDIQMPRCDGLTATRLIKAEMPACKVVMLTISEEEHDLFEAVKSGASGYLIKRIDAAELFAYLDDLEAGYPPFSPGLALKILDEFAHPREGPLPSAACPLPDNVTLSPRQTQILTLVAQGLTYREVGQAIGITERTVKYHMAEISEQLHLQNRALVIAIPSRLPAMEQCLEPLIPAVIILDLNEVSADRVLFQLRACPDLKLIAVDLASEDVLLLSGQRVHAVTMADIVRIITEITGFEE